MSLSNEPSSSAPGATVERLSVEPVPSRPRRPSLVENTPAPSPTFETAPPPPPGTPGTAVVQQHHQATHAALASQLHAVFAAIARVLAVKLQLLLTLLGAFVMAIMAMQHQSPMGLYLLVAWCCLAVLPMVWLDFASRQRRP